MGYNINDIEKHAIEKVCYRRRVPETVEYPTFTKRLKEVIASIIDYGIGEQRRGIVFQSFRDGEEESESLL